ncbi:MAG: hypothetical protein ACRYGP_16425 [Janthinobacterium lividum]
MKSTYAGLLTVMLHKAEHKNQRLFNNFLYSLPALSFFALKYGLYAGRRQMKRSSQKPRPPKHWDESTVVDCISAARKVMPEAVDAISLHDRGISVLNNQEFADQILRLKDFVKNFREYENHLDQLNLFVLIRVFLGKNSG